MAIQDTLNMIKTLQGMDMQEQQMAMQKEQQSRLMAAEKEKLRIRGSLGNAVQQAASGLNTGGDLGLDPTTQQGRGQIFQESGNDAAMEYMIPQMMGQGPEGLETARKLMGEQRQAAGGDVFGQQLRGMGTDLLFLSQEYGGGKVPTNQAELQDMTVKAAQDPAFGEKRQEWANNRTAGKFQDVGVAADDPNDLIIFDPKRGMQYRTRSGGDALSQLLTTATADESGSLAVYKDLHSVTEELMANFDENLVGLFDGNIENMKAKFTGTPAFTKFKSLSDRLRTIVYGFSGKQINETELVWLDGILPKMHNPDENYMARLESISEWVADKQNAQLSTMRSNRRFSGVEGLKTEGKGVSDERLKAFRDKLDKEMGVPGATEAPADQGTVIDLRTNPGGG
jgi:hypothetical protein